METSEKRDIPVRKIGGKVNEETAKKDIDRWLDYKKVSERKRIDNESSIDGMVAAVMDGCLVVSDSGDIITHVLNFPIGNNEEIKELNYKARLSIKERNKRLKGAKASDTAEYIAAHIAALASQNKAVIDEMDTEDHNIAQNIALFFI